MLDTFRSGSKARKALPGVPAAAASPATTDAPAAFDRRDLKDLERRFDRPSSVTGRIAWRYVVPIAAIHLLSLLALLPWFFSWTGVVLLVSGIYFYGGLGINIAYHRLLTHRSFACPRWLEHFFVLVALCCMEDAPGGWVATHRRHHIDSDTRPDPHTPMVSFFWSHMGWLLVENREVRSADAYERYARDVLRDPFYMRLQRNMWLVLGIYLAHAALYLLAGLVAGLALTGQWAGGVQFALSVFVWGVLLRTVCVWHITWTVNSLSHIFGYRTYETTDDSRNNWLVAFLTSGEGWHNNHHIDQASASNWHRWWEIDLMWVIIRSLEICGLATAVIRPRHLRQR
jgi:stearoyl-CoA desaturase (delta-9 desaturase)